MMICAKDLFYAMDTDLFMKRVQQDANWSLFCPNEAPNLYETHSDEFDKLYLKYEKDINYSKGRQST